MGKLNIAHHKSYHPYRRDNIERVRLDEEEARLKAAQEEGRVLLADSEARIELLRRRAGIGADGTSTKKKSRRQEELEEQKLLEGKSRDYLLNGTSSTAQLPTTNGHINFFQDLEQGDLAAAITTTKKVTSVATDKGFPLAPSEKDLNPWYSGRKTSDEDESQHDRSKEDADEKRLRDTARKTVYDPLTSINQHLSSTSSSSSSSNPQSRFKQPQLPVPSHSSNQATSSSSSKRIQLHSDKPPDLQARLTRESSERERALALIHRKRKEMMGSETPSTVHEGSEDGYRDIFNRKEVEEARRERERRRDRRTVYWEEEHGKGKEERNKSTSRRW